MGKGPDVSLLDARRDEQGPGDGARAGAPAFVASFLVQTHIGFASTAVPLLARVELLSRWTTVPPDEYEALRAERERLLADHGAGLSDLTDEELATQLGEIVDAMNGDDPTVTAYDVAVFLDERPAG